MTEKPVREAKKLTLTHRGRWTHVACSVLVFLPRFRGPFAPWVFVWRTNFIGRMRRESGEVMEKEPSFGEAM